MKVVVLADSGAGGAAIADADQKRKELEQCRSALENADQERHELLSLLAHELRNPLQSMLLRAQLAASGDPNAVANLAQSVEKQVTSMVQLLNDLLDAARLDAGGLDKHRVSLSTIVRETAATVANDDDHELVIDAEDRLEVDGDPERIAQMVSKYIESAIQQVPDGSSVEIAVKRRNGMVRCTVAGREAVSGTRPRSATIGLYLCRRLAELQAGRAGVDREPGRATTFWFELPLAR